MADETITLKIVAQDLASGNIGKFVAGLDSMAKRGGLMGSVLQGVGQSLGQMINPIALVSKGIDVLGNVLADSIKAFGDSQVIQAQTVAVLKSTGDAAGVTADQIGSLANAVSSYSGQDDEAIQKGENLLLTFTNIKDAVGAGNDVFTQTTKVMADMAQAMGGDAAGQAILLGKALNDPVAGLTALTRVGVTFSAQQKAQIAGFVKMGDVASAQKVILAELNKEFGGSAQAFGNTLPGAMAKFNTAFGNLEENIGGAVAGPLADLATWMSKMMGLVPPASAAVQAQIDAWKAMAAQAPATAAGAQQVGTAVQQSGDKSAIGLLAIEQHLTDLAALWDPNRAKAKQWSYALQDLGDQLQGQIPHLDEYIQAGIDAGQTQDQIRASLQKMIDAQAAAGPAIDTTTQAVLHGARAMAHLNDTVDTVTAEVPVHMSRMVSESTVALETLGTSLHQAIEDSRKGVKSALDDLNGDLKLKMGHAQEILRKESRDAANAIHKGLASKNGAIVADAERLVSQLAAQYALLGQMMPMWLAVDQIGLNYKLNHRGQPGPHTHHAAGGVISPGSWGMVGEQGPEMIYNAGSSGIGVVPNGGMTINVNFHTAYPPSPMEGERIAQALAPHLRREMARIGP